jgi:hypothetical protein
MASTYVNDLRLNEMATGDGSGTWGTTTNTNLELIAEAFSYGTEVITTNADTHTTTIADGATDPGRSLYLKYTGTLDSACTITIGPNTVSKVWIIENGTSGSQDIILSQGSGANITIPAGDTKVVYSDGAGAGAAFFDAFANLKVTDPAQTNITSVGTLTGLTITAATPSIQMTDSDNNADAYIQATDGNVRFYADDSAEAADSIVTFNIDGSERMRINSSGNVGIGTASPARKLDVNGSGIVRGFMTLYGTGTDNALFLHNTAYEWAAYTNASNYFVIEDWNLNQKRLVIDTSGNVGIGTSSPAAPLHVAGNSYLIGTGYGVYGNNDAANYSIKGSASGGLLDIDWYGGIKFLTSGGSERMRINSAGNLLVGTTSEFSGSTKLEVQYGLTVKHSDTIGQGRNIYMDDSSGTLKFYDGYNVASLSSAGAWTNASDIAYKENIVDTEHGLDVVKLLQPRDYTLKSDSSSQTGFIAQELETHLPQFVDGDEGEKSVNYGQLTAVLTKAIQEQQTIIESLTARITALES